MHDILLFGRTIVATACFNGEIIFLQRLQRDLDVHHDEFQEMISISAKKTGSSYSDDALAVKLDFITS